MKHRLSLLLASLLISVLPAGPARAADAMTLTALRVGKADCLLLSCQDTVYLFDTGTAANWGALSAALRVLGIDRLDGVILTHTHSDHTGGARALASSSVQVDAWYAPALYTDVKESKHPAVLAAALSGRTVTWLEAGDTLPFSGGTLTVLGPTVLSEKENCNSLVLRAEGAGGSILMTGDMEIPEEETLMASGLIAPATVLKVGNHGEKDATSDAFARAVSPRIAVISTDSAEEPDTPAKRVLKALKNSGAQVVLTQSAPDAVRVTVSGGEAHAELLAWGDLPPAPEGLAVVRVDNSRDTVTVRNTGSAAADLSGCYLYSDRGNEIFIFPEGAVLAPGAEATVSALDSPSQGDYVWRDTKVWHKSKEDHALLYDAYGRLLDESD